MGKKTDSPDVTSAVYCGRIVKTNLLLAEINSMKHSNINHYVSPL